ncbi:MAG: hypothetical protein ACFFEF_14595 [Candidatus Thorarchaeota archaeon]
MNDIDRQIGTRNATILMVFGGAFHLYLGYSMFQLSVIIPNPFTTTVGTVIVVIGLLTLCVSLIVWLQKSWATKIIAIVGIVACVAAVIFAYYLMIIILAPTYWFAIKQLRIRRVVDHSDWHVN